MIYGQRRATNHASKHHDHDSAEHANREPLTPQRVSATVGDFATPAVRAYHPAIGLVQIQT